MPIYTYNETVSVGDNEDVILTVQHPNGGATISHNAIDVPGPPYHELTNQGSVLLGKGADLKSERTVIFGSASNTDENEPNIKVDYLINGQTLINHSNPKSDDQTATININIQFT